MFRRLAALVPACALVLCVGSPAQASTMATADFTQGHTVGVGVAGASYDLGLGRFSLGARAGAPFSSSGPFPHLRFDGRAQYRLVERPNVWAGLVGGVQLDPGVSGGRSYLVPDVGIGSALRFVWGGTPLFIRVNLTVTLDQGQLLNSMPQPIRDVGSQQDFGDDLTPRPNLLQRLTFGPNTDVGFGVQAYENVEVTLLGGTGVGLRLHF